MSSHDKVMRPKVLSARVMGKVLVFTVKYEVLLEEVFEKVSPMPFSVPGLTGPGLPKEEEEETEDVEPTPPDMPDSNGFKISSQKLEKMEALNKEIKRVKAEQDKMYKKRTFRLGKRLKKEAKPIKVASKPVPSPVGESPVADYIKKKRREELSGINFDVLECVSGENPTPRITEMLGAKKGIVEKALSGLAKNGYVVGVGNNVYKITGKGRMFLQGE